ncbi:MAG: cation diffusion facilitator family transporter [Hyphomicrobiaceae bacterium]
MAAGGSIKVVVAAFVCNALIAAAKFAAAAFTGSAAMFAEAVHSLADTSNQALLLHGYRRSRRPPDARHPFGYAKELYFWSFVVAVLLFGLGAGVSLYEGVAKLLRPHPITNPHINYIVLGIAIALETGSTFVAARQFNALRGQQGAVAALRASKDAALFTVLLEDIAALLGLLTALAGIMAAHLLGFAPGDGLASIAIGLILAGVAVFLAYEIKGLLIGESAGDALVAGIRTALDAEAGTRGPIHAVNEVKTMQLGAADVLVAVSFDVDDTATAADIEAATGRLHRAIKTQFPEVRHLFLEVQAGQNGDIPEAADEVPPEPSSSAVKPTIAARPPGRKRGKGNRRRH